jgi:hypothetical protein
MGEQVEVNPGDIEDFSKRVLQLADEWGRSDAAPAKILSATKGSSEYPDLGEFSEADQLRQTYGQKMQQDVYNSFTSLHQLLEGFAEASKKIAENYRSAEELNSASVDRINQMLGEAMAPKQGSTTPTNPTA